MVPGAMDHGPSGSRSLALPIAAECIAIAEGFSPRQSADAFSCWPRIENFVGVGRAQLVRKSLLEELQQRVVTAIG
jgi:hypothetical protein